MPPEAKKTNGGVVGFSLSSKEFEEIRKIVKAKTGISLGLHKQDLVVSRLAKRLRALGLTTFRDYLAHLQGPEGSDELVQMINRITTNKTDFFRENHHFEYLNSQLLPRIYQEGESTGRRTVRCWSAGCSSGEEPYTLAMTLKEFFKQRPGWDVKILATDLDTTMLQKASAGRYEERLMEPVPKALLHRYFRRERDDGDIFYTALPEIRGMITYRKFNLIHPTYPLKTQLDFAFCRNVLIYFEQADKVDILTKMHKVIKPGGFLFVGHSESLMMVKDLYRHVVATVYERI